MKRTILTMLALLLACALLAGCGASSSMNTAVGGGAAAAAPQENYDMAMEESGVTSGETGTLLPEAGGRKLVYTATLDLETKTYTDARTALLDALDKAGGYVESNEEGGSAERGSRWSRLTLRVPADRYADFLNEASGVGNLVNKQEHIVVANIREWLVFTDKLLVLDRARFHYTLIAYCTDGHLKLTMDRLTYRYDEERTKFGTYVYKAEEWITDKEALNRSKTGLRRASAKFRRKTIDRKDDLFSSIKTAVLK